MLRTLAALPALLIALMPQPTTTDAPVTPLPSPVTVTSPGLPAPSSMPQPPTFGAPGMPMPMPAEMRRQMADGQKLMDQQRQFRRTILDALTPEHRALLSQIVGEMAVADDPDLDTATARLNAALTPAETQAIMRADQAQQLAMMQGFEQILAAARSQQSPVPQQPIPTGTVGLQPPVISGQVRYGLAVSGAVQKPGMYNSAGLILLRTAASMLFVPKVMFNGLMPILPTLAPTIP